MCGHTDLSMSWTTKSEHFYLLLSLPTVKRHTNSRYTEPRLLIIALIYQKTGRGMRMKVKDIYAELKRGKHKKYNREYASRWVAVVWHVGHWTSGDASAQGSKRGNNMGVVAKETPLGRPEGFWLVTNKKKKAREYTKKRWIRAEAPGHCFPNLNQTRRRGRRTLRGCGHRVREWIDWPLGRTSPG